VSTEEHDLVVIGAGPAGQVAAEFAAAFGRCALVVEQNQPGGVVTTTGGAPTKALREAVLYLTGFRFATIFTALGIPATLVSQSDRLLRAWTASWQGSWPTSSSSAGSGSSWAPARMA
jgi:pyruvate/2-oxoglutarate dehydrogenase complex dihydrolipoamide dehydrogenase (E3) component